MKVLVIGSGAREHAIIKAIKRSIMPNEVFCYGVSNNPGIAALTHDFWLGDMTDAQAIATKAKQFSVNLAIIGPEAPLEKHVADALNDANIPTIGPVAKLARIETSKAYARQLMKDYDIAGLPRSKSFSSLSEAKAFLIELGENNYVIKADGLMSGKGVKVAGEHLSSFQEALLFCETLLKQGQTITIEEKLIGEEFSLMFFCDGNTLIPMPLVQDHKRAFVNDTGPNTGGMGSYSDVNHSLPFLNANEVQDARDITHKVLAALQKDNNARYVGILYGSFMATARGVFVIEFNARFGDPEALNVLAILQSDFLQICHAMTSGRLADIDIKFAPFATVCKYAVPEGYPDKPVKNVKVDLSAIDDAEHLYLAGVDQQADALYATGSRTAAYVGVGETLSIAEQKAEQAMQKFSGPLYYRPDIGTAQLIEKRLHAMAALRKASCD